MNKLLTAILAVTILIAISVIFISGLLVGITGQMLSLQSPMQRTIESPIGGTIYNRIIEFTEGITLGGDLTVTDATTTLATTTVTRLEVSGAVTLDSDLTVGGTFSPAYISTSTTSTLATTTISKLDVDHVYVVGNVEVTGDTTLADATTTNHTIVTALQSIGTLIVEGLSTLSTVILTSATTTNATTTGHAYFETDVSIIGSTGIGTSTPGQTLTVIGSISATGALILDSTADIAATTTVSAVLVATKADLGKTIQGGSALALTDASTTLTSTQVCTNSVITQTATTSKITAESVGIYTLPTVTNLNADCLETNGDMMSILFRNTTSSFGASTTIEANVGIDLLEPSGGDVIVLPGELVRLDFTRITTATTTVEVTSLQKAD